MDGNTGLTLFEPNDIKLNIGGNEEEDEEDVEEQKRRQQLLKAQLDNAFDDWSDDDEIHIDKSRIQNSSNSPKYSTDDEDNDNNVDKTIDEARVQTNSLRKMNSKGLTFQNLSDISEHSVNKSAYHSSENSRVFKSGTETSPSTTVDDENCDFQDENQLVFKNSLHNQNNDKFVPIFIKTSSPSASESTFPQSVMSRKGDVRKRNQPLFENSPHKRSGEKFVPLFEKAPANKQPSAIENKYRHAVVNGNVECDKENQQIFKNRFQDQTGEDFQPFFNNNTQQTEQATVVSEEAYKHADLGSEDQLEVLYQVRLKEIQRLAAQLESERSEATAYKQKTLMQMALLQSEKERALLSRSEADKLLVACKDEITNLQKEVGTLKQALDDVEKDKKKSDEMLEISRVQLDELQSSMALRERCNSSLTMSKQTNMTIKNLKSKHQEELGLLQNQLESVTEKLLGKEEENSQLKQKLDQLTVEKAATISQLTRSLEDSQLQCQKLLESNVVAEKVGLQHKLNQVLHDKEELTKTVDELKEECRLMKTELETLSPTDSMVQMGMMRSRTHSSERSTNLQDELHRALLNQKAKRAEVERLHKVVSSKEKEIEDIRRQQQMATGEKEALSVELSQVKEELISMKSKYEKLKETAAKRIVSEVSVSQKGMNLQTDEHNLLPEQENRALLKHNEMKIEADLQLKEMSVRLDQSYREAKQLKDMFLGVTTDLGVIKAQLQEVTEQRDSLSKQLQTSHDQATLLHREKLELTSEIKKLKDQLANNCQSTEEENLRQQCTMLQQELTSMSTRHTEELSSARSELQATRDRVSQLEKTARLQFETRIKSLHQECEMLKTKCDEKEVQIKKLIESRKRAPSTASVATETDKEVDWEERLERERYWCRQQYEAALAQMEMRTPTLCVVGVIVVEVTLTGILCYKKMFIFAIICVLVPLSSQQCFAPKDEVREVNPNAVESLQSGELEFSADLIRTVSTQQAGKNVFLSPTSIFQALLMSYFIAANHTEASLKKTMHLNEYLDKLDYLGAYNLENYYQKLRSIKKSGSQVNLANRLYVAKQLKVQRCLKVLFSDELQPINFRKNVENARRKINQWVASQTNNVIEDFLSEDYLSKDTQIVLLNAAHFKGSWKTEFDEEDTHPDTFLLDNGTSVDCTMMVLEDKFKMTKDKILGAEVIELPYKGGDVSMFILLPLKQTPTSLQDMLQKIDRSMLKSVISSVQDNNLRTVTVSVPKFTMEETLQLTPILEKMGVGDLFQRTADLNVLASSTELHLTDAIHKAKIKVDEKGTEAAAATAFATTRMGSPIFRADRPFAYTIYDKTSNKLLFFGVFTSPP